MKKLAIALALISMGGMGLFAEGSQEESRVEPDTGYTGRGYSTDAQGYRGRSQMPMDSEYANPNQNYQPKGQMPRRDGAYTNQNFQGQRPMQGAPGYGSNGPANWGSNAETLTLTGTIDLTDVNVPRLTVGEESYELLIPYRLDYDIDIADGDEITISGFKVPAYRRTLDSELTNLMVTGASFNGKEYDLGPMDMVPGAGMRDSGPMKGGHPGRPNKEGFQPDLNNRGTHPQGMWNNTNQRPFRQ